MKRIIFIILSFLALTPAAISAQQYSDPVRMGWGDTFTTRTAMIT